MPNGMPPVGREIAARAALTALPTVGDGVVVMGLDQHRAQITAEWIDTATGEVSRARVTPADRVGERRFLARFGDRRLEVALEATTGWRFVAEELHAIGASPRKRNLPRDGTRGP